MSAQKSRQGEGTVRIYLVDKYFLKQISKPAELSIQVLGRCSTDLAKGEKMFAFTLLVNAARNR